MLFLSPLGQAGEGQARSFDTRMPLSGPLPLDKTLGDDDTVGRACFFLSTSPLAKCTKHTTGAQGGEVAPRCTECPSL